MERDYSGCERFGNLYQLNIAGSLILITINLHFIDFKM